MRVSISVALGERAMRDRKGKLQEWLPLALLLALSPLLVTAWGPVPTPPHDTSPVSPVAYYRFHSFYLPVIFKAWH